MQYLFSTAFVNILKICKILHVYKYVNKQKCIKYTGVSKKTDKLRNSINDYQHFASKFLIMILEKQ